MMRRIVFLTLLFVLMAISPGASARSLVPDFLEEPGIETGRRSVLFLMAHFDDDSVIAGTMNLYVRSGWDTHICRVTRAGYGWMWGDPLARTDEANKAMDAVGVPPENRHILGIGDREAKRAKKGDRYANRSQWFLMVPFGIIGTWRTLRGRGEPVRPTAEYDFLKPPHPGKLLYQRGVGVYPDMPFSVWQNAVREIPEFSAGYEGQDRK